jgi:hypothetical protein
MDVPFQLAIVAAVRKVASDTTACIDLSTRFDRPSQIVTVNLSLLR